MYMNLRAHAYNIHTDVLHAQTDLNMAYVLQGTPREQVSELIYVCVHELARTSIYTQTQTDLNMAYMLQGPPREQVFGL